METGVVPVLRQAKPTQPLPCTGVDEAPQVSFEALVQPLCLAVRLWVVGGAHIESSTRQVKQLPPKVAGEDTVAVGDDMRWHSMKAVDVVEEGLLHLRSSEWVEQQHEMGKLAELVDDDLDAVSYTRAGQPFDEIHRQDLPGLS